MAQVRFQPGVALFKVAGGKLWPPYPQLAAVKHTIKVGKSVRAVHRSVKTPHSAKL